MTQRVALAKILTFQSETKPATNTSSSKKAVSGPLQEEFIDAAESGAIDKVLDLLGSDRWQTCRLDRARTGIAERASRRSIDFN